MGKKRTQIRQIKRKNKWITVQVVDEPEGRIVPTDYGDIYLDQGDIHVLAGLNGEQYGFNREVGDEGYELTDEIKAEIERAKKGR